MQEELTIRSPAHRAVLGARRGRPPHYVDTPDPEKPRDVADAWGFDYRSRGKHDRDRVLYSAAFQRLAQITQVTASENGYVFHNRLSHSLKVGQVARSNVARLKTIAAAGWITGAAKDLVEDLDADAVEAGCLAHDLGHPPFGHIAERELKHLTGLNLRLAGKFEGNAQSFRIVTRLEQIAGGEGLNLTRQALETMLKYPHSRAQDKDPYGAKKRRKWGYYETEQDTFDWLRQRSLGCTGERDRRSLEAHIMDWADDLTYAVHDVEDFYCAGLIPLHLFAPRKGLGKDGRRQGRARALEQFQERAAEAPFFDDEDEEPLSPPEFSPDDLAGALESIAESNSPSGPFEGTDLERRQLRQFGSGLITDFLTAFTISTSSDGTPMLEIDDDARRKVEALKMLVHIFVIHRPSMAETQFGQRKLIRDLFDHYLQAVERKHVRTLPPAYRERFKLVQDSADDRKRLVVDLVSGLTEDDAYRIHHRLTGRSRTSALV
jgi:dGTPase